MVNISSLPQKSPAKIQRQTFGIVEHKMLKELHSVVISYISNSLYGVLLLDHSISGLPAASMVTWHGSM